MSRLLYSSTIIIFIILLVFYIVNYISVEELSSALLRTDPFLLLVAFVLMFVGLLLYTLRWIINVRTIGAKKSAGFGLALTVTSYGLLYALMLPAKIGQYVKATVLQKVDDVPYSKGISVVNIEAIAELGYLALMTVIALLIGLLLLSTASAWDLNIGIILIVLLLILFGVLILFPTRILRFINERLLKSSDDKDAASRKGIANWLKAKLRGIFKETAELTSNRKVLSANFLITLVIGLLSFLTMHVLILSLGTQLDFALIVFSVTISMMIGIVSMIPGGFGTMDFSLLGLLITGGLVASNAVAVVILWRVVFFIPLVLVFSICFARYIRSLT
jgi:uncharacterized protein (TIRG00374 family)